VRELAQRQRAESEERGEDAREVAIRSLGAGVEVVDALTDEPLTPNEEARVRAASKAIRLARLREAGARLKAAGRMPRRSAG